MTSSFTYSDLRLAISNRFPFLRSSQRLPRILARSVFTNGKLIRVLFYETFFALSNRLIFGILLNLLSLVLVVNIRRSFLGLLLFAIFLTTQVSSVLTSIVFIGWSLVRLYTGVLASLLTSLIALNFRQHCLVCICTLIGSSPKHFFLLMAVPIVRVVHRLGQSIGEIQKILGHPDRAQQIHLWLWIIETIPREQFVHLLSDNWHLQNFITAWSHLGSDLDQKLDRLGKFIWKYVWNFRVNSSQHLFVQALHVFGSEWWFKGNRLIQNASQRPNIRFVIIRLVTPDLGRCIIRGTRLSVQ